MGLDLWFKEDVARILQATYDSHCSAMQAAQISTPASADYRQGFADAIRAVGLGFGLSQTASPNRLLMDNRR